MATIPAVAQAWRLPVDRSTWRTHKSLELRQVQISPPKNGEALVRLRAAALNYRDILISHEKYPGIQERSTEPDGQGLILTSDGAGEIVALGEEVTEWKKGDRAHSLFYETWFDGPYEPKYMKRALGARSSQLKAFSRSLPTSPTKKRPLFPVQRLQPITDKSTMLVLGSGGVSVFGAQLCKATGARVIATTSNQAKAERYKALGVDKVMNYREFPEWPTKVKEMTGAKGLSRCSRLVSGQGTLVHSVKSVKANGHVHVIGAVAGSIPNGSLAELGEAIVSGHMVGSKAMCERFDAFITQHKIKPVIDRVFGWNEVIEALDYQLTGGHFGKIVVKIDVGLSL
ncbi:unnamed protein product [Rhizoctonia solani]|uniref:Enoyl reductase (ER) domain-containing protein n=1 Tax=Rhizoctonia solani TaxID=456999 RepID=A0A8H3GDD2_9AGAM|nr:unnamed protein product [Rhizoctonia solani]